MTSILAQLQKGGGLPTTGSEGAAQLVSSLLAQESKLAPDFELPNLNTLLINQNKYILEFNDYIKTNNPVGLFGDIAFKLTALKSIITPDTPKYSDILCNSGVNLIPPESINYVKYLQPIRNQGAYGTCVSFGSSAILEFQLKINNLYNNYLSPAFIYLNKTESNNEGMTLEEGLRILSSLGTPTEIKYPYSNISTSTNPIVYRNKSTISSTIYNDAKTYSPIITGNAYINSISELKSALVNNGPCLIGLPVYLDKNGYTPTTFWKPSTGGSTKPIGGHCLCIVGYNKNGFLFRNSWGKEYGTDGYNYLPYADWGVQLDCWTAIPKIPLSDILYLGPSPSPDISPSSSPSTSSKQNIDTYHYFYIFVILMLIIGTVYSVFNKNSRNRDVEFDTSTENLEDLDDENYY